MIDRKKTGHPETFEAVQPRTQRYILLSVLAYEAAGSLFGGSLLVTAPDGSLLGLPVSMMRGVFPDFLVPGLILFVLGVLNTAAFIAVLRRHKTDGLLTGLALGGLMVWFLVEFVILRIFHWLHVLWGVPVLVGALAAFSLVTRYRSKKNSVWRQRPSLHVR